MQVVILCGGTGTRLKEQTEFLPKALIPIGGKPMIVHIMKWYAHYGFKKFILALGHKQEQFKIYFANYDIINNDVKVDIGRYRGNNCYDYPDQWEVTMVDTGENTLKGGRLKRVEKYIEDDIFMMTYGDGIGDIDIQSLLAFHKSHGKMVTVTGVHSTSRFGEIHREGSKVISFTEKPADDNNLINGGFFVFNKEIFKFLAEDKWCDLEVGALELIAAKREMQVYHHKGQWKCLDTLRNMEELQQIWEKGEARWKVG